MNSIEEIESEWGNDSKIDQTDLSNNQAAQLELHSKYHRVLNRFKKKRRALEQARASLINLKTDYYEGNMAPIQAKEFGWEPNKRKIFKVDIERFLAADKDIIEANVQIGECNDVVEFLESIIRSINNKPFIIKNIIEDKKFHNGGY